MKHLLVSACVSVSLLLICTPLSAQQPSPQIPAHAPDGGTVERIQSIDIPAIPNAPFSAIVVTELTNILPDGSKRTVWNRRLVARDSAGRVFQERRSFSPTGQIDITQLSQLDYVYPNLHEMYLCAPNHVCRVYTFNSATIPSAQFAALPALVTLPNGTTIQREDLGKQILEGVDALGSREITTIPAGVIGNEKAQPIVKEFWYSPSLGINLLTKRFDPRVSAIQNFTVTQLNPSEPDPNLFHPPADYRIISMTN